MRTSTAVVALVAGAGLTGLTAIPASAAYAFGDCAEAAGYGVHNIPVGAPGHGPRLVDEDGDGIVCEDDFWPYDPTRVPIEVAPGQFEHHIYDRVPGAGPTLPAPGAQQDHVVDEVPGSWDVPADGYSQMDRVPVGGADTGAAAGDGPGPAPLVLGGLVLAGAGAAAAATRRRRA